MISGFLVIVSIAYMRKFKMKKKKLLLFLIGLSLFVEMKGVLSDQWSPGEDSETATHFPSFKSCNFQFGLPGGFISTPNHPMFYPNNTRCEWTIDIPQGYFISLSSHSFDLEGPLPYCPFDKLVICDVDNESQFTFCGEKNFNYSSHSSKLILNFTTDGSFAKSGFFIIFTLQNVFSEYINEPIANVSKCCSITAPDGSSDLILTNILESTSGTTQSSLPNPTTRFTLSPNPTTRFTTSPNPTTRFTTSPNPTTRFTLSPNPITRFTTSPNPTTRFTTSPNPTTRFTSSPNPTTRFTSRTTEQMLTVFNNTTSKSVHSSTTLDTTSMYSTYDTTSIGIVVGTGMAVMLAAGCVVMLIRCVILRRKSGTSRQSTTDPEVYSETYEYIKHEFSGLPTRVKELKGEPRRPVVQRRQANLPARPGINSDRTNQTTTPGTEGHETNQSTSHGTEGDRTNQPTSPNTEDHRTNQPTSPDTEDHRTNQPTSPGTECRSTNLPGTEDQNYSLQTSPATECHYANEMTNCNTDSLYNNLPEYLELCDI